MARKISVLILFSVLVVSNVTFFGVTGFNLNTSANEEIQFSIEGNNAYDLQYSLEATNTYPKTVIEPKSRTGVQNIAAICVHPSDHTTTRWTISEHEDVMETINQFYKNTSYNKMSINYVVKGWYDLGHNWSHYGSINTGNLVVNNWQTVVKDAIALADPVIDFNTFDYVVVWINTAWWRGWASIGQNINVNTGEGSKTIAATLCGENLGTAEEAVWGRTSHEIGHMFGLPHTHGSNTASPLTKDYESWYSLMARAYPSALNFYSSQKSAAGWVPAANIQTVSEGESDTFHVRPRYLDITGDTQAIKVKISNSHYYMVEVIEQESEDRWLPDNGVYIYEVDKSEPNDDECTDQDGEPGTATVSDCLWDLGETFTDGTNGITIEIEGTSFDGYDIVVTNAGDGETDLHIDDWGNPPGSPGPYETPDIWCDSPANLFGKYRHVDGSGQPQGIGDEPLLNEINRLYARITNLGNVDASGVVVKFYYNDPIGAGDTGSWTLIGTKTINVNKASEATPYVLWKPEKTVSASSSEIMNIHSCVKVVIEQHVAETNADTADNEAQENINGFEVIPTSGPIPDSKASRVFGPVTGEFSVYNPFKETKDLYVNIVDVTEGWEVTGQGIGEIHTFDANERKDFDITIIPGDDATFTDSVEAHLIVCQEKAGAEDQFTGDIHLERCGGVTLTASIYYRSELSIDATILNTNEFKLFGNIQFLDGVPEDLMPFDPIDRVVYMNIVNKDNSLDKYNASLTFDEYGDFDTIITLKTGAYKINGYYTGSEFIASAATETLVVDLINTSVWTSGVFPGFGLYLTLGAVILIASIYRFKRRK